jgi:hypothetical protein
LSYKPDRIEGQGRKKKTKTRGRTIKNRRREWKKRETCVFTQRRRRTSTEQPSLCYIADNTAAVSHKHRQLRQQVCSPLSFFFFISPYLHYSAKWRVESELIHYPLFTCNVSSGEHLHCLLGRTAPTQTKMVRPSTTQSKKNSKKKLPKIL